MCVLAVIELDKKTHSINDKYYHTHMCLQWESWIRRHTVSMILIVISYYYHTKVCLQ